jgi:hypothetical protein
LRVQAVAVARVGTQLKPLQNDPDAQPESAVHEVGHVVSVPSQRNGVQDGLPVFPAGRAVHVPEVPVWSQASQAVAQALLQQTPWAQNPVEQSPFRVQAPPRASLRTHWNDVLQK